MVRSIGAFCVWGAGLLGHWEVGGRVSLGLLAVRGIIREDMGRIWGGCGMVRGRDGLPLPQMPHAGPEWPHAGGLTHEGRRG